MENKINDYFDEVSKNFVKLKNQTENIELAADAVIKSLQKGNKIIFCGNGGSAGDSQHLAAELMGRYKVDRKPLPAISLTVDTSAITAIGNDYGYENVFSRQLKGIGNKDDVLISISTSGKSKNVLEAIKEAKKMGIYVISFTGISDSEMKKLSDLTISAQSNETNHIQEMHIAIGQLICGIVEDAVIQNKI
ncbi:MAG: SIS domain-containing protein [Gammaproteobacteria bacterium]|tara:strand:- start:25669 stop:26244 length:576 start_codon:yes stop_codon:yes gene_type:complete